MLLPSHEQQARLDELDCGDRRAEQAALADAIVDAAAARSGRRRCRRLVRAALDVGARRAGRALRARRKLLGHLGPVPARPDGHRRTDVRCRPDRPRGRRSTAIPRSASATSAPFDRTDRFSARRLAETARQSADQRLPEAGRSRHRRGYDWRFDDIQLIGIQRWAARLTVTLASDAPAERDQLRTRERLTLGDWYHVALTYDGSGKAAGLRAVRQRRAGATSTSCSDTLRGSDRDRCAAARRQPRARPAVRRADRRPAALRPRARARADRQSRDSLSGSRHRLRRARQAIEGRRPRKSATTS